MKEQPTKEKNIEDKLYGANRITEALGDDLYTPAIKALSRYNVAGEEKIKDDVYIGASLILAKYIDSLGPNDKTQKEVAQTFMKYLMNESKYSNN